MNFALSPKHQMLKDLNGVCQPKLLLRPSWMKAEFPLVTVEDGQTGLDGYSLPKEYGGAEMIT